MFFQTEMEAMSKDLEDAGYTTRERVTVLSSVLPKGSSEQFLKSVGLTTPTSSKSSSTNENELREQLAAEAKAAVQGEVDELKKKSAEAEERMERQEKELEEYKKKSAEAEERMARQEKEMEENRALLKGLLRIYAPSSST
jgi:flagellar motility protein MotE (MotC chaperone)